MRPCVCGCAGDGHREVSMSVPLLRAPGGSGDELGGVAYTYPTSTYERDECSCGCCEYIEDAGVEDAVAACG